MSVYSRTSLFGFVLNNCTSTAHLVADARSCLLESPQLLTSFLTLFLLIHSLHLSAAVFSCATMQICQRVDDLESGHLPVALKQ